MCEEGGPVRDTGHQGGGVGFREIHYTDLKGISTGIVSGRGELGCVWESVSYNGNEGVGVG